jgi:hypothetical protein
MNINRNAFLMALGSAMIPWGFASAQESLSLPRPLTKVGRISDSEENLTNSTVVAQRPVLAVDQRPEAFRRNSMSLTADKSSEVTAPAEFEANVPPPSFQSVGFATIADHSLETASEPFHPIPETAPMPLPGEASTVSGNGCLAEVCNSDDLCSANQLGGRFFPGNPSGLGWVETDALLWWGPRSSTPELVLGGPRGSLPNALLLGGVDSLGGDMTPGLRTDFGLWLDDCQSVGVGGRAFGLFSGPTDYRFASSGETLALSYFNTSTGLYDLYLVAFDTLGQGVDTGSVEVTSDTDFISADAYGKFLLAKNGSARADLLGGYTFARFDDSLGIHTRSVNGITDTVPDGTVRETADAFALQNTFHGGLIGFTTEVKGGRFALATLGKVAIGSMQQAGQISGRTVVTAPGSSPVVTSGGVYAQSSNSGTLDRDVVSFLPEAGVKLRYCFNPSLSFNVGYTFLCLPDVVMAGSLIDTDIDVAGIGSGSPVRPAPRFENSSYYLHGIDLGLSLQF